MYFLVNASPLKPLDVATSNFADALVRSKGVFVMTYRDYSLVFLFLNQNICCVYSNEPSLLSTKNIR